MMEKEIQMQKLEQERKNITDKYAEHEQELKEQNK